MNIYKISLVDLDYKTHYIKLKKKIELFIN